MSSIVPIPLQPLLNIAVIATTRKQVVEVRRAGVEAGDFGHALEQLAEEEQPDEWLDERDRHEPRLAKQRAGVALGHVHGLSDRGHA